jgi:hypothetical protein
VQNERQNHIQEEEEEREREKKQKKKTHSIYIQKNHDNNTNKK